MKLYQTFQIALVAGVTAFAVSSCAYDPYHSGGGYSTASGSAFISTGNSQWGYDPTYRAYYNYNRKAYYDPYLNGYYPTGYRPQRVYGAPHPHGYNGSGKYIAPPRNVRNYNLKNYQDRNGRYKNLGRGWSRDVRGSSTNRDDRSAFYGNQRQREAYQRGTPIVTSTQQRGNNQQQRQRSANQPSSRVSGQQQQAQKQAQARQQQQRKQKPQPKAQAQPKKEQNKQPPSNSPGNRFNYNKNSL